MKIHEYQAKEILRQFGVPVPKGEVAETPAEARSVAGRLGGRVVVKAQVHAGDEVKQGVSCWRMIPRRRRRGRAGFSA